MMRNRANPTLKTFVTRVWRGLLLSMQCKGTSRLRLAGSAGTFQGAPYAEIEVI